MKILKKNLKEIDKEDLGFQEEISEEGFIDEPIDGTLVMSFDFKEDTR